MKKPKPIATADTVSEPRWPPLAAAAALTVFSLVLGYLLYENGDKSGFWYDELWSLDAVSGSVQRMLQLLRDDFHPPGYHVLLYGWVKLVGSGETAVRSLSMFFLLATLPLTYLLGREFGLDRAGAVLGAGIASMCNIAIWFGVEARPYALLLFLTSASLLSLTKSTRARGRWAFWLSAVLGVLALYSHYAALFVLVPAALVFALQYRDRRILWLALLWIVSLLPWAIQIQSQAHHFAKVGWLKPPTWASAEYDIFKVFGFQRAPLLVLVVMIVAAIEGFRRKAGTRQLWLVLAPLVMVGTAVVSHLVIPIFHPRYFFTILPFAGLTAGYLIQPLRPVPLRWLIAVVAPLGLAFVTYGIWKDTTVKGEDWRGPAEYALSRKAEAPLFVTTEHSRFFRHYIPEIVVLPEDDQAAIERWLGQTGNAKVWFLQARQFPGTAATRTVAERSRILLINNFTDSRAMLLQLQP